MGLLEDIIEQEKREKEAARARRPGPAAASPPKGEGIDGVALMHMVFPEPKWAVEGVIPEGATLLAGRPKSGKSWLALHLALAVAAGGTALGRIQVAKGAVLYLALEDNPRRVQGRLKKLLEAQKMKMPWGMTFYTSWRRNADGGIDAIREWLEEHRKACEERRVAGEAPPPEARLVIVDTLSKIRDPSSSRGNAYDEDYRQMGPLQQMALECGVAVLGVTHTRKPKSIAGETDLLDEVINSSGMTGAADTVAVLERSRLSRTGKLFITGRDVDEREIPLAFDPETGLWSLGTPDTNDPDAFVSPEQRSVRQAIRSAGRPLKPAELSCLLKLESGIISQRLKRMNKNGLVVNTPQGWALPEERQSATERQTEGDGFVRTPWD